jgi:transposase
LARLGIRNFKPTLRKAAERLATVHTPEGIPLPPNTFTISRVHVYNTGSAFSEINPAP